MNVLVACEFSGTVRDAFIRAGHDAMSCDLLPTESPGPHYVGDVRDVLGDGWDLMVAEAAAFVRLLWDAPIERVAIENPVGMLNRLWRYPDDTIEPWMFGDPYRKRTCLWLRGLPPLLPTAITSEREYWIDSYPGRRSPGVDYRDLRGPARSAKDRARTFPGIAQAMADQWGRVS